MSAMNPVTSERKTLFFSAKGQRSPSEVGHLGIVNRCLEDARRSEARLRLLRALLPPRSTGPDVFHSPSDSVKWIFSFPLIFFVSRGITGCTVSITGEEGDFQSWSNNILKSGNGFGQVLGLSSQNTWSSRTGSLRSWFPSSPSWGWPPAPQTPKPLPSGWLQEETDLRRGGVFFSPCDFFPFDFSRCNDYYFS